MNWESKAKAPLERMIKREEEYLAEQKVGTEEYNNSQKRLMALQSQLIEAENTEIESKDRFVKFILECGKVLLGAGIPLFCFIKAVAQEREITFTGAARILLGNLIPGGKKLF